MHDVPRPRIPGVVFSKGPEASRTQGTRHIGHCRRASLRRDMVRHEQFQHRLLQVRPVVFGIAMGDVNRLLVTLGYVVTTEGKASRVEMMEALLNAFLDTDSQRQFAEQQVAAPAFPEPLHPALLYAVSPRLAAHIQSQGSSTAPPQSLVRCAPEPVGGARVLRGALPRAPAQNAFCNSYPLCGPSLLSSGSNWLRCPLRYKVSPDTSRARSTQLRKGLNTSSKNAEGTKPTRNER
jgi:hypothetical protein